MTNAESSCPLWVFTKLLATQNLLYTAPKAKKSFTISGQNGAPQSGKIPCV
jgi:hypothetical protein